MSYGSILAFVADINKYNIIRKKTLTCILSFKSKSKNCIATFSLEKEILTEKQNLDDTNDLRFAVFYMKCFGWIWKRYNTILENMLFRYSGMYHRRRLENNNKIFLLFHITFSEQLCRIVEQSGAYLCQDQIQLGYQPMVNATAALVIRK